jgi:hypothetical protein
MSFLSFLKRAKLHSTTRWIIKYNTKDEIREIKQLFNPKEYSTLNNKHNRTLYNQKELIEILESKKK